MDVSAVETLREAATKMHEIEVAGDCPPVAMWSLLAEVLDGHADEHDSHDCQWHEPCAPLRLAHAYLRGLS